MTKGTTSGRYSSRNSSLRENCAAVERDTQQNRASVELALDVIDESLRTLPQSLEVAIVRRDKGMVKDLLALSSAACDDALRYRGELKELDRRLENNGKNRPRKESQLADHYSSSFGLGSEYIQLNQRVMETSGKIVSQITEILDGPNVETAKTSEVES